MTEATFPVSEIFHSIQGEGPFTGRAATFLRFQFCNLTCRWCDTKGTWLQKSGPFENTSAAVIREKIARAALVVVTGGEPLLHDFSKIWGDGLSLPPAIQVETNGTVHPLEALTLHLADGTTMSRAPLDPFFVKETTWVISPKFGTSKQAVDPAVLAWWAAQPGAHFKFVVGSPDDLKETEYWVGQLGLSPHRVWLMPEGLTRESQIRPDLAEAAVARGWNFSLRVHTLLWGNEKGR